MERKSTVMMMGGRSERYRNHDQVRLIPKRGQVKMAILANVAHTMLGLFTATRRSIHLTH
ncbi:hypothetical protein QJS04_geneDACA011815 [Acorus gramineus]|uniref:Uncharacterized protein n=1 Tax=Acorus gramineus TaxID=55184 RepID=A0AAV9BKU2_ACOGR|nr:hypothetical protein QJS04_geneDACA011815 [Acorus gramineus]